MLGFLVIAAAIGFRDLLPTSVQAMMVLGGIVGLIYPVVTLADDGGGDIAYLEYPNDVLGSQTSGHRD